MAKGISLRARLVPRLLAWAGAHGLDPKVLARHAGVSDRAPQEEEPLVPLSALRSLGAAAAEKLDDPLLGMHLAESLGPSDYGAIGFLARSTQTLGEALQTFVSHATALNAAWSVTLEQSKGQARLRQRIAGEPEALGAIANQYFVCGLVVMARRLTHTPVCPLRAWLAHPAKISRELTSFLGCEVEAGVGENGLSVAGATLSIPVGTADPALKAWLERAVLKEASVAADPLAEMRRLLRGALPDALPVAAVAKAMGQSTRTLQRRLTDERTSFARELDRARMELAQELLGTELSLGEIAYRTGYADPRAFSRAFKRWTGKPPGAHRLER